MKNCCRCATNKQDDEFSCDKTRKDGRFPVCKVCVKEARDAERMVNPERLRKYGRDYIHRYDEKHKLRNNAWERDNKEWRKRWQSQWRKTHPEYVSATNQRYRARKANAPGKGVTAEQWERIVYACNSRCTYCNAEGQVTMDHIVPLSKGGAHDPTNVVPACMSCNTTKRDQDVETFLEKKYG